MSRSRVGNLLIATPLDIICITQSGRKVGVELVELLAEGEFEAVKLAEELNNLVMEALGDPQPSHPAKNFTQVRFKVKRSIKGGSRHWLKTAQGKNHFREQFFEALRRFDEELTAIGRPPSPQDRTLPHKKYLVLDRFLELVRVDNEPPGDSATKWIEPYLRGGSWDPKDVPKTLADTVSSKVGKEMATLCDEFVVLVYYSRGWRYAAPLVLPHLPRPSELLGAVRSRLPKYEDRTPFSKAYLYLHPDAQAFRLW